MIDVVKYEDGLPISVIIPTSNDKIRKNFFENFVFPLIEANQPIEIIINDDNGGAPKKRNDGFRKSTQPFVFFCDDDILLPLNYLNSLYNVLIKNDNISFTYTGYDGIVLYPETHPIHGNFKIPHIEYDFERLKFGNYINTEALIRRECFPFFDERLKRFQDWDLWLTIGKNGGKGKLVHNLSFFSFYIDEGITSIKNNEIDAYNIIRNKHKI